MSINNLNLLTIFYEVVKQNSISKAAEKLFISQPAISQSIKKLEQEIGGTLFIRNNKGINLTQEGRVFFEYVESALNKIQTGESEFLNFKDLKYGTIKIGISTTLAKICLLLPMQKFHADYPNIKFEIVNNITSKILNMLESNDLDLAIYLDSQKNTSTIKTLNYCLVSTDNALFDSTIELKNLSSYPLILQNTNSVSRQIFDNFCKNYNIKIQPYMEVVSQELVSVFAGSGLGVGYVLREFLPFNQSLNLRQISTKNPLPNVYVNTKTSANGNLSFATKKFLEYLKA